MFVLVGSVVLLDFCGFWVGSLFSWLCIGNCCLAGLLGLLCRFICACLCCLCWFMVCCLRRLGICG